MIKEQRGKYNEIQTETYKNLSENCQNCYIEFKQKM